jgi:anti-sigma factor RsiW
MWGNGCRWVRTQLPLLAGGELIGPDRRWVERHLIGCAHCQTDLTALRAALDAVRIAAEHPPVALDSPSLWPALELEIQESRRVVPRAPLSRLASAGLAACAALGLALGLLAFGRQAPARRAAPRSPSLATVSQAVKPAAKPAATGLRQAPKPGIVVAGGGRSATKGKGKPKIPVFESSTFSRPNDDADRGAGASADTRDTQ